jgi:C6 transcription factor Pro1
MYLISEIACLEAISNSGIDDIHLCQKICALGRRIKLTETCGSRPEPPFTVTGVLNPKQLNKNITAAFRLAARIYLCSLAPNFSPSQATCIDQVSGLALALEYIPAGPDGFDRSVIWVYLIGGSVSMVSSPFRSLFNNRLLSLGELADQGNFGRVA